LPQGLGNVYHADQVADRFRCCVDFRRAARAIDSRNDVRSARGPRGKKLTIIDNVAASVNVGIEKAIAEEIASCPG
jgi:hypothetical protein